MIAATFFIMAKNWKQLNCLSVVGEWINKLWYIHTVKYYSVINVNKLLMSATTWVCFRDIILRDRNQIKRIYVSLSLCPLGHMCVCVYHI